VQRPWDRTPRRNTTGKRKPAPAQPAPELALRVSPNATHLDTGYPAVGTADLSRAVRAGRVRRRIALLSWIAFVLVIALIVFLGSRPAPTGF